ncbi:hypothetical protein C2G38_2210977 [Gigaspora rosea]|uniref:Uncharacterized protein n=1 Tax=Gigaspora rosea TaxID=44941 RepID=A0A397UHX4_9GLOM|nr:hypothetical protein C2G38_2210977 [Gigaspora rosea]
MNPTNNTRSTQILTNKIELDNKIDPHISIKDQVVKQFFIHKVFAVSSQFDDIKKTVIEDPSCSNGFAAAILHAYNYHKHLRLSPDDVWITISQGVSEHINRNSEKFRNRFVQHEGKKKLINVADIISGDTLEGNWPEAVNRLVTEADKHVEKIDIKNLLECNFSTTTSNSLMASLTLDGTLEDWMKLQEKVVHLRKLNLELDFWLDRLEPVIWNLVATYRGEVDEDYWGRIVNINKVFGSGGGIFVSGCEVKVQDIPDGIVGVPFDVDETELKFIAGFIGANQEFLEGSDGESVVSPVIGWCITDDIKDLYDNE